MMTKVKGAHPQKAILFLVMKTVDLCTVHCVTHRLQARGGRLVSSGKLWLMARDNGCDPSGKN